MQNAENESRESARSGRDIQGRTYQFALRVLKLVSAMEYDTASAVLARQIARSATSVGANVEEAAAAHTKVEFIRKMNIARGEARETRYWLRLIADLECVAKTRLSGLLNESEEILKIVTRIVANARKNAKP